MILWFHRNERDTVHVYKTPNGRPPKRLSTGSLDPKYKRDSICFRGFLRATGIRLRPGELQKMDWAKRGQKIDQNTIKIPKKRTTIDSPKWLVEVIGDTLYELHCETMIGPPLPPGWTRRCRDPNPNPAMFDQYAAVSIGTGNTITVGGVHTVTDMTTSVTDMTTSVTMETIGNYPTGEQPSFVWRFTSDNNSTTA